VLFPLEILARLVNTSNNTIDFTINVKGTVISGSLVSLQDFHEYTSDKILGSARKQVNGDSFGYLRSVVDSMNEFYSSEKMKDLVYSYICIKNPVSI
jgi:hypothetical protein